MSKDSKTILEWSYEPNSYFEVPTRFECFGGEVLIDNGLVKGTFASEHYGERDFRDAVHELVEARFLAQQVQSHKSYELSGASMYREHPDGSRDVTAFIDTLVMKASVHAPDIVITDREGNVVSDSKAERVKRREDFGCSVVTNFQDPALKRMVQSFHNAITDEDNSLIHLYEIKETVDTVFGKSNAKRVLGIADQSWSRLIKMANNEPLVEGRHRGKHDGLRRMSEDERNEVYKIAQGIIENYVHHISTKDRGDS
tara:strand:- start:254 stop:1021 length:768 start_codon:yes stop_codon:yes gene_type:complete